MIDVRTYTEREVRDFLANYVAYSQGATRSKQEDDPLVQKQAPAHEAPWANRAVRMADLDLALSSCGHDGRVAWMAVSLRDTEFNRRRSSSDWREQVGSVFGLTAGEVTGCISRTVANMQAFLNGG